MQRGRRRGDRPDDGWPDDHRRSDHVVVIGVHDDRPANRPDVEHDDLDGDAGEHRGAAARLARRPVPAGAIDDLRKRLGGTVLTPEDPAYATSGLAANTRYATIRPAR